MVNENYERFKKEQQKHESTYLGSDRKQSPGLNDPDYNNQDNTGKSVGVTGRK
ncbi:hypothetical protein ACF5W4_15725 [Bacillota bacterium Lsc_1132]